jgi:rhodanese-related sulfurtransferase
MFEFPLPLAEMMGKWGSYSVYFAIGMGFGFILESAGFGNSKKLAAQFYFKDLAVFKVMFTAIITAMVLVFLASGAGLLDYNLVWVPPTYLWPGIVGGFIMGIGFIIGGFCPGTSLVALATKKVDGMFFVGGVLIGIFIFGETEAMFSVFFNSSFYGRFTLPELFGVSYGTVVTAVVVMALVMFLLAEMVESKISTSYQARPAWTNGAAAALVLVSLGVVWTGQPSNEDRWQGMAAELEPKLEQREVQISPQELLNLMNDNKLKPILLDVRDEVDYNQFHIYGARLTTMDSLLEQSELLQLEPGNAVVVVMSNDEQRATEAWKILKAESLPNVYLLDGGVNHWLRFFADEEFLQNHELDKVENDCLAFNFDAALGSRIAAAEPEYSSHDPRLLFEPKIKLQLKRAPTSGGCS